MMAATMQGQAEAQLLPLGQVLEEILLSWPALPSLKDQ
jgi:hypothetical protein